MSEHTAENDVPQPTKACAISIPHQPHEWGNPVYAEGESTVPGVRVHRLVSRRPACPGVQPAEHDATKTAREVGLPYCPACGDMAHPPSECAFQNLALGRCVCPKPGFERGVPSYMARVIPPAVTTPTDADVIAGIRATRDADQAHRLAEALRKAR